MLNQPTFRNNTPNYLIYYYGQEGTSIQLIVDDTLNSLVIIQDNNNNTIGQKFHEASSGNLIDIHITPLVSGSYEIHTFAYEVTLANQTPSTTLFQTFENKKDEPIMVDVASFDVVTFLDNNFWFYYGCNESEFPRTMIEDLSQMVGGYNEWAEYQESDFLPDVFSSSNIFKLLYTDQLMTPSLVTIHHRLRNLNVTEFGNLPTSLQYNLDSYYNINSIWIVIEDDTNTMYSILLDDVVEYGYLELLREAKKFTYGTDANVLSLPMDEATFLTTYYDNYATLSPLGKAITVELYYLHYNLDDAFVLYNDLVSLLNTFESATTDKSYYLMVSLYTFIVINKILKKKVIDNSSNVYITDYWSNQ